MLLANSKLQTLARTPNKGYFTPPSVSKTTSELPFRKGDIKNWDDMEDNRVIMLLRWHGGKNSFAKIDEQGAGMYKGKKITLQERKVINQSDKIDSNFTF